MVADGGSLREFRRAGHLEALAAFLLFSTAASAARTADLGGNRRPRGASEPLLEPPELPPISSTHDGRPGRLYWRRPAPDALLHQPGPHRSPEHDHRHSWRTSVPLGRPVARRGIEGSGHDELHRHLHLLLAR